ncbi:pyridoxamine 5'-phosphate oxidase family protein [Aliiglaciecola sp. LCG003]|uniref:pyridoxamine 5'-phosphate oxidase family protein n=1 Tax=Aliiglaciecola sp. LCG003 TaxID=3053655 RepID=UPI002572C208|nr:pyridoxamine 5'-phosphate oxidase family protein [Aliiglaciecola sp. LCG003]WJG08933.1 pyridoxamine 5'-phosphate oxidase family protein [Aliiglaciecola sp. LCG003]
MSKKLTQIMWKAMADSPYVMVALTGRVEHSEPMRAQLDEDANDCFWFYTTKTNRIAPGGKAMIQFVSKDHKVFACIKGSLSHETDPAIIDKYWSRQVEAWYEDGKKDDSLKMMRFDLVDAEIWEVDPDLTGMLKLATGVTISPDEMGSREKVNF